MKKRILSVILAVLMVASLSVSAFADEVVPDNPSGSTTSVNPGQTMDTNNGTVTVNSGTVTTNNGTITTDDGGVNSNYGKVGTVTGEDGYVETNEEGGTIDLVTEDGKVGTNCGTITTADGGVTTNNGTVGKVTENGDVLMNGEGGSVGENNGIITFNFGTVEVNNGSGDYGIGFNINKVKENNGNVLANGGTVEVNNLTGTVTNSTYQGNPGTVGKNYGTVTEADGTTYYGLQVVDTSSGEEKEGLFEQITAGVKKIFGELFSRDGYTLKGYSETEGSTSAEYDTTTEYTLSKAMKLYAVWTEKSTPAPAPSGDAGSGSGDSGSTPSTQPTVPTYKATTESSADAPCSVTLTGITGGNGGEIPSSYVRLIYKGTIVDTSCYTLSVDEDGNIIVTFTEEYLKTLPEGVNPFDVISEADTILATIKLTIEK